MQLPCAIGDYTDFFTGIHHATAVGKLFRPDNPLLPNYKWVPIGYHGRASSIGVSAQAFVRPMGQSLPAGADRRRASAPASAWTTSSSWASSSAPATRWASRWTWTQAEDDWFGIVLLNDWSARDIQTWEYQPLGPFLAKNFATTISPWIVTREALEPFRAPFARPAGDPQPLPYLDSARNRERGQIDIALQVLLQTEAMREQGPAAAGAEPLELPRCVLERGADAGPPQQRRLQPAAPATCSAPARSRARSRGRAARCWSCRWAASSRWRCPAARRRSFLQDGDTVILRAHCERAGRAAHRLRRVPRHGAAGARPEQRLATGPNAPRW